ncbi:MAG: Ig-like domain-containing protein [Rhodopila sp.]
MGPAVYTETGYSTASVSQAAQAQGDLDILMDDARNGVAQTYLYQLLDAYPLGSPHGDDGGGLFDPNGVAKTAAVAIHDLTTILADTNTPLANPVTPGFTVSGLPADGSTLDIEKSNGTQEFVVWNETSGSHAATVNLGAAYENVAVFDPMAGSTAIANYTDVSSVNLSLDNSPIIVQVSPLLAPVVVPAPSAPLLAASSDSGVVGDGITNVTQPTFTGSAAAGDVVKLYDAAGMW